MADREIKPGAPDPGFIAALQASPKTTRNQADLISTLLGNIVKNPISAPAHLTRLFNGIEYVAPAYQELAASYGEKALAGKQAQWFAEFLKLTYEQYFSKEGRLLPWVIDAINAADPRFKEILQNTLGDKVEYHAAIASGLAGLQAGNIHASWANPISASEEGLQIVNSVGAELDRRLKMMEPFLKSKFSTLDALRKIVEREDLEPESKIEITTLIASIENSFDAQQNLALLSRSAEKLSETNPTLANEINKLQTYHTSVILIAQSQLVELKNKADKLYDELRESSGSQAQSSAAELEKLQSRIAVAETKLTILQKRLNTGTLIGKTGAALNDYILKLTQDIYKESAPLLEVSGNLVEKMKSEDAARKLAEKTKKETEATSEVSKQFVAEQQAESKNLWRTITAFFRGLFSSTPKSENEPSPKGIFARAFDFLKRRDKTKALESLGLDEAFSVEPKPPKPNVGSVKIPNQPLPADSVSKKSDASHPTPSNSNSYDDPSP